ncbi:MAG: helix-turn-helix domain-containing protein [Gammaproteobacteria bacterium]
MHSPVCFNVKRAESTRLKKTRKIKARNCIGPRVRQARLKAVPPVSQEDLAGRLSVKGVLLDRSAVSRIESQERYIMDYEAAALADVLKVSMAWLFQRD